MKILPKPITTPTLIVYWIILLMTVAVSAFYFIKPNYRQWNSICHQNKFLKLAWQKHHLVESQLQDVEEQIKLLEEQYHSNLKFFKNPISLSRLLTDIASLTQKQNLELTQMKPISHRKIEQLTLQKIQLDINGKELNILTFLRSMMQKNGLCDYQVLQMSKVSQGVRLQAIIDVYYVSI